MQTIITRLLTGLLGALAEDAIRIVTEVALSDATNAQKRKAAVAQLKAAAKAKQIVLNAVPQHDLLRRSGTAQSRR